MLFLCDFLNEAQNPRDKEANTVERNLNNLNRSGKMTLQACLKTSKLFFFVILYIFKKKSSGFNSI